MDELITKVMATFFEGLEDLDAPIFGPKEAEVMWWLHEEAPHLAKNYQTGQVMVSKLGIFILYGFDEYFETLYTEDLVYLPEGIFFKAHEGNSVQYHLQKYFKESVEG